MRACSLVKCRLQVPIGSYLHNINDLSQPLTRSRRVTMAVVICGRENETMKHTLPSALPYASGRLLPEVKSYGIHSARRANMHLEGFYSANSLK